jgi:phosphatidylglycerol:prolipoprotein diacylglycerol transferase
VIDSVAFQIGPIQVHWYGIIIASAVFIAGLLGTRVARWLNEDPDDGWAMLLLVLLLAIVGARLYHVIHLWEFYSREPAQIIQIWNGGLGIPGGVVGGALGIWISTRARGLNTARWMDIFAPACLPWGIQIDQAHRAGTPWTNMDRFPETTPFVPLFAYEMALNLIGVLVLVYVIRRFAPRLFAGDAVLMYIMWYGAVRTLLETYRVNNWTVLGLPTAMWIGIIGFVLAGAWLIVRHRRGSGSPMIRPPTDAPLSAPAAAAEPEASAG